MATIEDKAKELLGQALQEDNGRQAQLLAKDGPLRQTIIALRAGETLAEHNSPPAASVFLLRGQVKISAQEGDATIEEGELEVLTHYRHSVEALEDSVFLLTTVTNVPGQASHSEQRDDA